MIPWDLDNSFVGAIMGWDFWSPSNVYQYDAYYEGPPLGGTTQPWDERPLLYNLLNEPLYRKIYTAHIRTIINESLDTAAIRSNINQLQALAYTAANQDQYKVFSMNEYFSNAENAIWANFGWGFGGIMSTVNERKSYLLSHPEISYQAPNLYGLNINNNVITINADNAINVELMATTSEYNSRFESFVMHDDGTNGDVLANDGVYTVLLPFSSGLEMKFYIRAQNNEAVSLLPERAEYEFYEYSIPSHLPSFTNNNTRLLIEVRDLLGRRIYDATDYYNIPLLYIYDNGVIEKKVIVK